MRQPKTIRFLGQAVPVAMSFTMVGLMVSCGSTNGGKVAINKTGGSAAAVNSTVKAAFANFNENAAQNVSLSARVEGASMTLQYANTLGSTGSAASGASATAGSVKQFSIAVKMLVDDDDSTKPAFVVSVADTINANSAVAGAAASTADDSEGVVRAAGVDAASADPSQTPAPVDPSVQATPTPATNVKPGLLAFASDSSPGVSSRFRVIAKCADSDCAVVNVALVEREASTDTSAAGYDAKTQMVRRQTVRSFKNVVVDTKRLANEEHDMRIQYTAPTTVPTTTTTPGAPLTPQQRARGTKTNPSVTTVHKGTTALTPAFNDAVTARQKLGLPISGMGDDSSSTPATASTPTPVQTPAPAAPAASSTSAIAPAATSSTTPSAPAAAAAPTETPAPAEEAAPTAPATSDTYVGSEGTPELEAQPPSAGNVR